MWLHNNFMNKKKTKQRNVLTGKIGDKVISIWCNTVYFSTDLKDILVLLNEHKQLDKT